MNCAAIELEKNLEVETADELIALTSLDLALVGGGTGDISLG